METGIELIVKYRQEQLEKEGYGKKPADFGDEDELAIAASCYALPFYLRNTNINGIPANWPFSEKMWSPSDYNGEGFESRIKDLIRAGSLIIEEIDRLNSLK